MAKKADTIIYGNIYTVDKKQPNAAAAAIADGKFIYVGDEAGVREYITEGTKELHYAMGSFFQDWERGTAILLPEARKRCFLYI